MRLTQIISYILSRGILTYFVFFFFVEKTAGIFEFEANTFEDIFYIFLMLGVPILIETILFTPIFIFLLEKSGVTALFIFCCSLVLEFILLSNLFSMDSNFLFYKIIISTLLFFIFFRKIWSQ